MTVSRRSQGDEPDCRGQPDRLLELAVEAHRRRAVEHDADRDVVLGLEQADEQLPRAGVQRVVDAPVVVAGVVLAVVGEVDRRPEVGRAVLAGEAPGRAPARHELQPFQLGEQVERQQFERLRHPSPATQ